MTRTRCNNARSQQMPFSDLTRTDGRVMYALEIWKDIGSDKLYNELL